MVINFPKSKFQSKLEHLLNTMTSSPLSQSLHALFKDRSINASEMNLVVDNAICPSREFVDEVLHMPDDSSSCCSLDDSFSSILYSNSLDEKDNEILSLDGGEDSYGDCRRVTSLDYSFANILYTNSLDEQEDEILSPGGDEDSYGGCRWQTTDVDNKKTSLVPPCRCPTPSSKTTPMMPKLRLSNAKGKIPNWMLQLPTDGSGNTFSKTNVADILKETDALLTLDSPASTNPVVLNTVRNYEIVSKST
jgi:hypothetical protein